MRADYTEIQQTANIPATPAFTQPLHESVISEPRVHNTDSPTLSLSDPRISHRH